MNVSSSEAGYRVELTNDERSALVWALEVGRALLLDDPDLAVLAAEKALSAALLDDLADRLFLMGATPDTDAAPVDRLAPGERSPAGA